MSKLKLFLSSLSIALAPVASHAADAGNFPNKPVKIIVGYNAGAGTDIVAREVAERLSTKWKVPVVVENRSGANTIIATNMVANASPDGYTLLLTNSSNATNPAVYEKLPYDYRNGFTNIGLVAIAYNLVTASAGFPVKNLKELIEFSKKNPGKYTYGSVGIGSAQHLLMEMVGQAAKIEMTHVPYKGAAAGLVDVIGGRVSGFIGTIASQGAMVRDGKLTALFVTGAKRSPVMPDTETLVENGFKDIVSGYWMGLSGPAGMPAGVVKKINADINDILKQPDLLERLDKLAMEPMGGTPAQMDEYFKTELAFWTKAVEIAGIERLQQVAQ